MAPTLLMTCTAAVAALVLMSAALSTAAQEAVDSEARAEAANAKSNAAWAKSEAAQAQAGVSSVAGGLVAMEARVAALEAQNAALLARLAALEANTVLALDGYLFLDTSRTDCQGDLNGFCPAAVFDAVNVQIVNGTGQTLPPVTTGPDGPNGLGNLIIGYDEAGAGRRQEFCSDGTYDNGTDCEAAGGIWFYMQKSGTHTLVVGTGHNYTQAAGVIFGDANYINRNHATVTGGFANWASGESAGVSGGGWNTASGSGASVSGGSSNTASGGNASVSGGQGNEATNWAASVSGGLSNMATANSASVSGGGGNTASGNNGASVSGGQGNTASGSAASISGGWDCTVNIEFGWGVGSPDNAGAC
jgi:hypothetical protein